MRNRIILMILVILFAECSMKKSSPPANKPVQPKAKPLIADLPRVHTVLLAKTDAILQTSLQIGRMLYI